MLRAAPDMSQRHSVLLFDLGGVLIESTMFSELKRLMNSDATEAALIERWLRNPLTRRFELGQCSASEFAESVVREFELPIDGASFLTAFAGWPKGFYAGAESTLAQLRRDHTVCCLSNSNSVHWNDALTSHFDFAFSSHLIGHIKPDASAFTFVLESVGVPAQQVYFFDDAIVNVEAARRIGLNAHHTVGYTQLVSTLTHLGF
jgi:putative hydrolase of the HAD superfamily